MEEDLKIFFEQYRLLVETSETLGKKRDQANRFYLQVNSFLAGLSGTLTFLNVLLVSRVLLLIGTIISLLWFNHINSYKLLNAAKFRVIHKMERKLPFRVFYEEDIELRKEYYKKKITKLERYVPLTFMILYGFLAIVTLFV